MAKKDNKEQVGRPTKYRVEYNEQARKLCLLGYIDKELSDFFNISEVTLNSWKKEFPEFLKSLKGGKEIADSDVADSLYNRANGYKFQEVKIEELPDGSKKETYTDKFIPPDTGAAMAWLKNRQPKKWRDKQVIEHEGETTTNLNVMTEEQKNNKLEELKKRMSDIND